MIFNNIKDSEKNIKQKYALRIFSPPLRVFNSSSRTNIRKTMILKSFDKISI